MNEGHLLSKSTFLRGVQCKKSLYLDRHQRDLRDLLDVSTQRRMTEGQAVHALARDLFPGGTLARAEAPFDFISSLENTQALIDGGESVLYEAAIQHDGVLTFADILVRQEDTWTLYEVKSANDVKDPYAWDVALQVHLLLGCDFDLTEAYLVHLNREYIREGDLDLEALFVKALILEEALALRPRVEEEIERCKSVLLADQCPEIDIGPYCTDPVPCDFHGHCWAHIPEPSVFNVYRLATKKKHELYSNGVIRIEDIPDDYPLPASSDFHVQSHKSGHKTIDRAAIKEFLEGLNYPLSFLDFETFTTAIPPYDGLKPHAQVPYQYSLHVQEKPGGDTSHTDFLAQAGMDPRSALLEGLLRETEGHGDILAYSMSFEKRILRALVEWFPAHREALEDRLERMKDLMLPFQKRYLYLPEMHGSSSLKSVLPALLPEMGYDDLAISDGIQAMEAFLGLVEESDPEEIERVRQDLWKYCELDTLAMVRILEELRKV